MKKKLLIVDDSLFVIEEMKRMLQDSDFEITEYAKSGEEAIDKYEGCLPDVVTMDIILPGIDGMEAAEIILKRWPEAKVVVISSLAYDETISGAEEIGARGFLFKPFSKEELLDVLTKAVSPDGGVNTNL